MSNCTPHNLHALKRRVLVALGALSVLSASALELNQASEAELDGLKGMGPSLSRKVLAARKLQPFASWADFRQRVPGVGVAKATAFSNQGLTIQGHPFSSATALPP